MTGPADIDLRLAGSNYEFAGPVTKLTIFKQVSDTVEALREQVKWLEDDREKLVAKTADMLDGKMKLSRRAEAAEAKVKTLQARVTEADVMAESAEDDCQRAITATQKAKRDLKCLEESTVDSRVFDQMKARVSELEAAKWEVQYTDTINEIVQLALARDTAEAHATELAGALEALLEDVFALVGPLDTNVNDPLANVSSIKRAHDTLAATPAKALERARGFEQLARDAVSDLRRYARDDGPERRIVSMRIYEKSLAKLNALDPAKRELTP